jgi:Ca2+ transporting ATPase
VNVFRGIHKNPLFCSILLITSGLQAIIIQFGSVAFHVAPGGLDGKYWGYSLAFGAGSLPVQQVINLLYRAAQHYKQWRMNKRLERNFNLQRKHADEHDGPHSRPTLENERHSERGSQRSLISNNAHLHDD